MEVFAFHRLVKQSSGGLVASISSHIWHLRTCFVYFDEIAYSVEAAV